MEKPNILYVDDERQNLVSFKASFRREYEIFTAVSGDEALEMLKNQPQISVVISDQRMPGMTGVQLFEKILSVNPEPVRMVMTGYSDMEAIIQAVNKGKIYYYISKPWKRDELKLIIENALEAYRLKTENKSLHQEKESLLLKAEQQKKAHILSQFETLKNQVNPHFLFNSLNALSSLVHEDPDLAEQFIAKLTRVYRYVLDLKEEDLVPLSEEINFVENYFFLQQIRFGNSLQLYIQLATESSHKKIPPLTLQILVENAIKHNIASREQPLMVELFSEGPDQLVVRNNYQKRQDGVESTGLGLANLRARYKYLSERQPEFYLQNDHYIAKVPLIDEN